MPITRRTALCRAAAAVAACGVPATASRLLAAETGGDVKFTMDLRCGAIGVRADQRRAIELAHRHGFESVSPEPRYLATLDAAEVDDLLAGLKEKQLVWGAAGLPVEFRADEATFEKDLRALPRLAQAMERAGVTRVGTWLKPNHDELTYTANFRQHVRRLRSCASILSDAGIRLGFEYVGPKTLWAATRHSFIHTMAETKELNAEIGLNNVGLVLDSWHWYTAHEDADDLRSLTNSDIVACDLNDAPQGVAIDEQIDNRRNLPTDTGVIDLSTFLGVLVEVGYDGPIRAEPFNQQLNAMEDDAATATTAKAMQRAFALVRR